MLRKPSLFFIVACILSSLRGNCQAPELVVQSFDFVYEKSYKTSNINNERRVILATADSVQLVMKSIFARALKERWNLEFPSISWNVKQLAGISFGPKFNTRLKVKEPGKWYLFLLVFEEQSLYDAMVLEKKGAYSQTYVLKTKLVKGDNDSVVHERHLKILVFKRPPPEDQVMLKRLPAYPTSYLQGIDSIAKWLFQAEEPKTTRLQLTPACVFAERGDYPEPAAQFAFSNRTDESLFVSSPTFSLESPPAKFNKVGSKKDVLGNTVGGALTLFTGIGTNKNKSIHYKAEYLFKDQADNYLCNVNYYEAESAEREREVNKENGSKSYSNVSTSYQFNNRWVDSGFVNTIILGSDTLVRFNIKYRIRKDRFGYTRMWDGRDSGTIMALPPEWLNASEEVGVVLEGECEGDPFAMKTYREKRVKEMFLNDKLVMVIYGNQQPERAEIYGEISPRKMKIFTMLSTLPYSFFNYSAGED